MKFLAILFKCASLGVFVGFLVSREWGAELWPFAGLMLFAGGLVALYELSLPVSPADDVRYQSPKAIER